MRLRDGYITKLRKQKKIHVILLLLFKKKLLNQIRRVNLSKLESKWVRILTSLIYMKI